LKKTATVAEKIEKLAIFNGTLLEEPAEIHCLADGKRQESRAAILNLNHLFP
jgi:hypothetical protein